MAASTPKFVDRDGGEADPKEIDKSVKNRWNWSWCDRVFLEGTPDQHLVGDCFRKLYNPGEAWCLWCNDGNGGLKTLRQHATGDKHKKRYRERRTNYCLNFASTYEPPAPLRLNGAQPGEGRVEIYHDGEWRAVCDTNWDMNEAQVVCQQLGYPGAIVADTGSYYGGDPIGFWLANVQCLGTENQLDQCGHPGWGEGECSFSQEAGVVCETATSGSVRLVEGRNQLEGRVEVYLMDQWGSVCDDYWSKEDADVVCGQLGFGPAAGAFPRALFGEASGPILMDDVDCLSTATMLLDCQYDQSPNCAHSEDASLQCTAPVRLTGSDSPAAGIVEVYRDGAWGKVCVDHFTKREAAVACRQLGFFNGGELADAAQFTQTEGEFLLDDVSCEGDEVTLALCQHNGWGIHDCFPGQDVAIQCAPPAPPAAP